MSEKKYNIGYSTLFVYIKRNSKVFKGYWIWDNKFSILKNKLMIELLLNHKNSNKIYYFIGLIYKCFTLYQLESIFKKINEYYSDEMEYNYKLYCNGNEAIKEVKNHNGDIFIDYYKTIKEDCLKDDEKVQ